MGLNEVALGIPVPNFWAQNMARVIGEQTHGPCIPRRLCHHWCPHICTAHLLGSCEHTCIHVRRLPAWHA